MSGGQYRLEIASTSRAGCQNGECKQQAIKIQKGELRFGTFVTIKDYQTWRWKHWGCVTPKQLEHVKVSIEGNYDYLDGFEELSEQEQARVRKALEEGHVADDDWTGDPEMNRPGMNGYRTPASKKKRKEEKEEHEAAEGQASPSKSSTKKRGLPEQEANGEKVENKQPASKKSKLAKMGRKVKKGNDEDNPDDEVQIKTKGRKKRTKVKAEAEDLGEKHGEAKPKGRKAARSNDIEKLSGDKPSTRKKKGSTNPRKAASTKVKQEDSEIEGSIDAAEDAAKSEGDGDIADSTNPNGQSVGSDDEEPQPKKGRAKDGKAAPKKPQNTKVIQPKKVGKTSKAHVRASKKSP